ncbi:pectinesterase 1-like [Lotus japonicus]|uniref:pectinesterase 1-like n=1 Tax=Lotus japonicus TaxID=34305 RepID=UPI002588FDD0|nr:pectinesterase 1-like [Lotus japonicus]
MASKTKICITQVAFIAFLIADVVLCDDNVPVPADRAQVDKWFSENVGPLAQRKATLDPALVAAEDYPPKVVKVKPDGSGDFKTITEAINSIPIANAKRMIVYIAGGNYNEKVKIDRGKPFITFYGEPGNMPNLTYGGTAKQYGTLDSATLIVESDYFVATNIIFSNSAPRPDGREDEQAVALRITGDKAAFYNCKFFGFQDTLCDDRNKHFFKDCFFQGTVDFIFGSAKSLYLRSQLNVLGDAQMTAIAAQGRKNTVDDEGFTFVHCDITGTGNGTYLARAWMSHSRVIYAYSQMTDVVNDAGWTDTMAVDYGETVYFGEYNNAGPGADRTGRPEYVKQLSDAEVKPFITLASIEGSKWLLPPSKV